ncbi:MAG TPA: hypothetical protein VHC22_09135 [Pirellulales bacterium]|nr:hypothetical protein [Pirellulales bacterium]
MPRQIPILVLLAVALAGCVVVCAEDEAPGWNKGAAGNYLDERARSWFAHDGRGEGNTRSTCISCHTVLPYLLARPVLRTVSGAAAPTEEEARLLAQTRMRVENWKNLDTPAFRLFYDSGDQKKQESRGTEAILNAVILAGDDRRQARSTPSAATQQAFSNLWSTQIKTGAHRGAWEWLDFDEPPWGYADSRYLGATLAAIAVGTAPGYYSADAENAADSEAGVGMLREYLRNELSREDLHNQAWALWAAVYLPGILAPPEQQQVSAKLFDKQREDGGWALSSLGMWSRVDGSAQETASDGYATGLILHVLQAGGASKSDKQIAKGLDWLKRNQTTTGDWRCVSVIKKRDPDTHVGKFMSDAATAFAILALAH